VLTAASIAWAAVAGPAFKDAQRLTLYLAVLVAATALLRPRAAARAVEPALAAGCAVVIGYGLSARLLPGVIDQAASASAAGRLEQPLTYWNAVGAVAAIGLVLCTRLAGDGSRPRSMRAAAAAACPALGMGLYITYSRGALAAAAAGLLVLVALAPERRQVRALVIAAAAAGIGALVAEALPGVASLAGSESARIRDGAIGLTLLAAASAAAAWAHDRLPARDDGRRIGLPRARVLAAVLACTLAALAVAAVAASERRPGSPVTGASAKRLASLQSHRYEYWKVAVRSFADHPLAGVGSGNFRGEWLRERPVPESTRDAHSLYLETAAELGLAGLAALALMFGGAIAAARQLVRRDAVLAAGPLAAMAAWSVQAGIDWLWEMPAVTLMALVLLATVLARADEPG
jgi:hypothetical protein